MGVCSGGQWIFIHGTDIVDRGLKVLFFGLFSVAPPSWKRLNSANFRIFAIFQSFFVAPPLPGNFSTILFPICQLDTLETISVSKSK